MVSSFCKDDVTKSRDLIKDLAETFLTTELFLCETEVASYILKVYSKTMCNLFWEKVDDGVKIKGPTVKVVTGEIFIFVLIFLHMIVFLIRKYCILFLNSFDLFKSHLLGAIQHHHYCINYLSSWLKALQAIMLNYL